MQTPNNQSPLNTQPFVAFLLDQARGLCADFSCERSVKLSPNKAAWDRFLLGVDAQSVDKLRLGELLQDLGVPLSLRPDILERYGRPSALLLGFEQSGERTLYKLYFEYWDQLVEQVKREDNPGLPKLLNLGFKWDKRAALHVATTEYWCHPLLNVNQILDRVRHIVSGLPPPLTQATIDIILTAARHVNSPSFTYMEASEVNGRSSFDLKLYQAELQLADIRNQFHDMANVLGIDRAALRPFEQYHCCPLGHLSAGIGRNNEPFVTLYFEDASFDDGAEVSDS